MFFGSPEHGFYKPADVCFRSPVQASFLFLSLLSLSAVCPVSPAVMEGSWHSDYREKSIMYKFCLAAALVALANISCLSTKSAYIEQQIGDTGFYISLPMKCLDFKTPAEAFGECGAALAS
jgi:hypothetical protein